MSTVTIGGQTFIRTEEGWVDKKTKVKAPEGLTKLLDNVAEEESPAGKKKRVRIDTSRPVVKLGKSEYVWDLNGKVWIDKKTKDPVNPAFSKLIEATYQSIEQGVTADDELFDKSKAAKTVVNNMGSTGQAAQQKVKKPTGGGQFPVANIKINSPIVTMIEKLAVIDSYLQQRLNNQKLTASKNITAAREQQIEGPAVDAQPAIDEERIDAQVEEENKKSNAAMIATAVGAVGLIAAQFDPVREAFSSVVDFAKGVYSYVSRFVGFMNESLESMTGRTPPQTGGAATPSATSSGTPSQPNVAGASSSSSSGAEDSNAASNSSAPSASTGSATPSRSQVSSASRSQASRVSPSTSAPPAAASEDIVVTAPRRSTGSSRSTSTRGSSGSPDATRTSAPPPASTPPPVQVSPDISEAANGTVWTGTDADGMKTFVRKINNKFETWTSADSTHYEIDASQAQAQISSRGLRNVNTGSDRRQPAGNAVDGYINPVDGYDINSGYGMRNHPVQGGKKFHTGVDIAAPEGTPVRAVKGGTVTKISNNQRPYSGFGNAVIIDHGDGYQTVYAHLSKFACRQGDVVQQGQVIGYVGSTGMSTGAHLHFIVQKTGIAVPNAGNTVNPAPLLRAGGVTIPAGMEGYDMESGGAGSSALQAAASAGWAMTEGAMEAVGNILKAAIDSGNMKTIGLGTQMADMTTSQSINKAARERNAEIAATRSADEPAAAASDPLNLNASVGSSTIQNLPTASDMAGVEYYLTRMGFPKIEYHRPGASSRVA